MRSIIIRPAGELDLDSLCDLYLEFHEFHALRLPAFLRTFGVPTEKERFELQHAILKILNDSDSTIVVAENSERIIGFAEIHLKRPDLSERGKTATLYAHLQSLSVTENYRRRKVGTLLLKAAEEWAHTHGALELRLDIWEFLASPLGFYQKSGYRTFRRSLVKNL